MRESLTSVQRVGEVTFLNELVWEYELPFTSDGKYTFPHYKKIHREYLISQILHMHGKKLGGGGGGICSRNM